MAHQSVKTQNAYQWVLCIPWYWKYKTQFSNITMLLLVLTFLKTSPEQSRPALREFLWWNVHLYSVQFRGHQCLINKENLVPIAATGGQCRARQTPSASSLRRTVTYPSPCPRQSKAARWSPPSVPDPPVPHVSFIIASLVAPLTFRGSSVHLGMLSGTHSLTH